MDDDNNDSDFSIEDLTSEDIEMIRAAAMSSVRAQAGNNLLKSSHLMDAPDPSDIKDVFSSVLGDPFHAMDRPKIPTKHEAKKSYKVAFSNALFIWNPRKVAQLEKSMRDNGMTDEDIENERFFNSKLYLGCVDRLVPSPKLLYWRVRACLSCMAP